MWIFIPDPRCWEQIQVLLTVLHYNNVPTGPYSFTAVATDNELATATSTPVNVTVNASNTPPTVSITSPTAGSVFPAYSTVTINANANDVDGTVSQVAFFANGNLLETDYELAVQHELVECPPATYSLTAVATDNLGTPTTSAPVNITVNSGGGALPSPWQHSDIGAVGVPGSASHSSGTFDVTASGNDIEKRTDAFHFVYQPLSGNGEIVARVSSIQNTHSGCKSGSHDSTTSGSKIRQCFYDDHPSLGPKFKYRPMRKRNHAGIRVETKWPRIG